jgi:hypothetical protein
MNYFRLACLVSKDLAAVNNVRLHPQQCV